MVVMNKPCFDVMENLKISSSARLIAVVCGYLLESDNYVIEPRYADHHDSFYSTGWYNGLRELVDVGILYHKKKGAYIVNKTYLEKVVFTAE